MTKKQGAMNIIPAMIAATIAPFEPYLVQGLVRLNPPEQNKNAFWASLMGFGAIRLPTLEVQSRL